MKIKFIGILSLTLFFGISGFAQNIDDEIVYWINTGDYLQLKSRYEAEKNNIQSPTIKLLTEAYLHTAFNKPNEALTVLNNLLTNHQEFLGMDGIIACIFLQVENLRYVGKYQDAAELIKGFVDQTDTFNGLAPELRNALMSQYPLYALGNLRKPEIMRPAKDVEIPVISQDDLLNDPYYINVTINGNERLFLLDTGAEGYATNMVTEKFAKDNGINILQDSVVVYGMQQGFVKLGVLEEMKIGELTYKNVAFSIAPGDNLLPVDTLHLDAILGSVFLKAVGEFQIYPNKKIIKFPIRQTTIPPGGSNMMLSGGQPYVEAYTNDERLLMHFDTGASLSLSNDYFVEHQEEIETTGELKKDENVGGFGGTKKMDKYILKNFPLRVGNSTKIIDSIEVFTREGLIVNNRHGSIGTTYINLFDKVVVNFTNMFVIFE